MKNNIAAILCFVFVSGCAHQYTTHNPAPPTGASIEVQQIATLAFVSYAGDDLKHSDERADEILQRCISWELRRQPILANQYRLAWGPSVHRFKFAELDDNMMYAVWDDSNTGHLVIGIRGTNAKSISDWISEDFFVNETVAWSYGDSSASGARISKATNIGLSVLKTLTGKRHCANCTDAISLKDFLLENAQSGSLKRITVTGHSLAGALAPTFALWLHDAVLSSDNIPAVDLNVIAIAGATPGNEEFATYYDKTLGEKTNRLHNPFDAVPQSWFEPSMRRLPSLYMTEKYSIRPTRIERAAFDFGIKLAAGKNYTHIKAQQTSTGGVINPKALDKHGKTSFAAQAGWQHSCGYYNALGMSEKVFNANASCLSEAYCQQNPTDESCVILYKARCQAVP